MPSKLVQAKRFQQEDGNGKMRNVLSYFSTSSLLDYLTCAMSIEMGAVSFLGVA